MLTAVQTVDDEERSRDRVTLTDAFAQAAIRQFFADYRHIDCIDKRYHYGVRRDDGATGKGSFSTIVDGLCIPEGQMHKPAGSDDRMALADMLHGLAVHAARFPHTNTIIWRTPASFSRRGDLVKLSCRLAFIGPGAELVPLSEVEA